MKKTSWCRPCWSLFVWLEMSPAQPCSVIFSSDAEASSWHASSKNCSVREPCLQNFVSLTIIQHYSLITNMLNSTVVLFLLSRSKIRSMSWRYIPAPAVLSGVRDYGLYSHSCCQVRVLFRSVQMLLSNSNSNSMCLLLGNIVPKSTVWTEDDKIILPFCIKYFWLYLTFWRYLLLSVAWFTKGNWL